MVIISTHAMNSDFAWTKCWLFRKLARWLFQCHIKNKFNTSADQRKTFSSSWWSCSEKLIESVSSNFPLAKDFITDDTHKILPQTKTLENPRCAQLYGGPFICMRSKQEKQKCGLWMWICECCVGFICRAAGGCLTDMKQFFLAPVLMAFRDFDPPACF